jgi:hypothetical protein
VLDAWRRALQAEASPALFQPLFHDESGACR